MPQKIAVVNAGRKPAGDQDPEVDDHVRDQVAEEAEPPRDRLARFLHRALFGRQLRACASSSSRGPGRAPIARLLRPASAARRGARGARLRRRRRPLGARSSRPSHLFRRVRTSCCRTCLTRRARAVPLLGRRIAGSKRAESGVSGRFEAERVQRRNCRCSPGAAGPTRLRRRSDPPRRRTSRSRRSRAAPRTRRGARRAALRSCSSASRIARTDAPSSASG